MKIGIDLSPLQGPHRMRGIGYTLISFINHLSEEAKKEHEFVFYINNNEPHEETLSLLNLDNVKHEVSLFTHTEKMITANSKVNRLITVFKKRYDSFIRLKYGDNRIRDFRGIDHLLIFDQSQPIPAPSKVKTTVILYDLIPYILERDYLWNYRTARNHGRSRKSALRHALLRTEYLNTIKKIAKQAHGLIAISEYTKQDFIRYIGIPSDKISVCLLGVDTNNGDEKSNATPKSVHRYVPTSWGSLPQKSNLPTKPFLLFVGGADPRRKLVELVAAFNNLRAQGVDIQLVLAGDTMLGPDKVPNVELQSYLKNTSYLNDIYFLGFVDDNTRDWLYKNACAFVYPSVYEGFGLPILEAMRYGTPVITYDNTSIKEIAESAAIYVNHYSEIEYAVKNLLEHPEQQKKYTELGVKQAQKFTWKATVKNILATLKE